jgi:hypothetical protein
LINGQDDVILPESDVFNSAYKCLLRRNVVCLHVPHFLFPLQLLRETPFEVPRVNELVPFRYHVNVVIVSNVKSQEFSSKDFRDALKNILSMFFDLKMTLSKLTCLRLISAHGDFVRNCFLENVLYYKTN